MSSNLLIAILAIVVLLSLGAWSVLKRRVVASRTAVPEFRQPVPNVTGDDLERIIRRDFPRAQFENVMAIVKEYTSQRESSATRVQVAALKLANGSLDLLRKHIAAAKLDYRDVLTAAEYPEYWKVTGRTRMVSKQERQRAVEADWKQYESWLRR